MREVFSLIVNLDARRRVKVDYMRDGTLDTFPAIVKVVLCCGFDVTDFLSWDDMELVKRRCAEELR